MDERTPAPLSEFMQYPERFPTIAVGQRSKENFLLQLVECGRLQDLDQEIRDELLLFYVRQSTRLLSECAELKGKILKLERGSNNG